MKVALVAENVIDLHVPRLQDWGPSVSVNKVTGPLDGLAYKRLLIEMQSGDVIKISAGTFVLPAES